MRLSNVEYDVYIHGRNEGDGRSKMWYGWL